MTSVFVEDPNAAYEFYTDVLGFKEFMHIPEVNLAIVVTHANPDGTALLLEPNDNPIAQVYQKGIYDTGLPVIVFGSDNVQEGFERLSAKGVRFIQEPQTNEYGTTAIMDDSFGNYIQIHQND